MQVKADVGELEELAGSLRGAHDRLVPEVDKRLTTRVRAVAALARANAPKDRPWLSTTQGVVVRKKGPLVRVVVSPRDPDRQSVGYRVEYGTSTQPPRPFMGPALAANRAAFEADMIEALRRASL